MHGLDVVAAQAPQPHPLLRDAPPLLEQKSEKCIVEVHCSQMELKGHSPFS